MKAAKFAWRRVAGEAMLIVASVFVAILLESMWQTRSDAADARIVLTQILQELRADRDFIGQVLQEQENVGELNSNLLNWFANPESLPAESVHEALRTLNSTGLTMWPRHAAWTTMVAAGQLSLLGDSKLVFALGDYYEHKQQRLNYNGQAYDADKWYFHFRTVPKIWDSQHKRPLTDDSIQIADFRNQILKLSAWNQWYMGYLTDEYGKDLNTLIYEVEQYSSAHGNAIE